MSMQLIIRTIMISILLISISSANVIFVSLKKNKVNVRYGPSFDSDIKYWKKFKWIHSNYRFIKFKLQKSKN